MSSFADDRLPASDRDPSKRYFIGLMSGTSADAIDGVLIECTDSGFSRAIDHHAAHYPAALRDQLLQLGQHRRETTLDALVTVEQAVTDAFAAVAQTLIARHASAHPIAAIGAHGQTIFHRGGPAAATWQLIDGGRLAESCGLTSVTDFRRRDIALGGQGAPLVPAFHHALFATAQESRAVLNLGGIANLTLLPNEDHHRVLGFDTGPANALLDEWCLRQLGQAYDVDGAWAATGKVVPELLDTLLNETYFAVSGPKSTGRGQFNLSWVSERYPQLSQLAAANVQATLAELTASSVVTALYRAMPHIDRLLVCGGGAYNRDLLGRIQRQLAQQAPPNAPVVTLESTAEHGLDPQWVEAAAFAWLAMCALDGIPGNLPAVTGARTATVLGAVYRVA